LILLSLPVCLRHVNKCFHSILLADKLVNGLASENERWGIEIEQLKHSSVMFVGNSLLAAAFVSYIGAFDQIVLKELWQNIWFPDLKVPYQSVDYIQPQDEEEEEEQQQQ
jgi:hypothetical protein